MAPQMVRCPPGLDKPVRFQVPPSRGKHTYDTGVPQSTCPEKVASQMSATAAKTYAKEAGSWLASYQTDLPRGKVGLWIKACEKAKMPDLAAELINRLVCSVNLKSVDFQPEDFDSLLGVFCKGGEPEMAVIMFEVMSRSGVHPTASTVCWLISALVKTGSIADAELWFQCLRNSGKAANITAYNALISSCSKEGGLGLSAAILYYRCMIEDNVVPSMITLNALIKCVQQDHPYVDEPVDCAAQILMARLQEQGIDHSAILALVWSKLTRQKPSKSSASSSMSSE
eukprot:CAMPEP_0178432502 /NCGR_PEP_ID=MMETSP0689_2-20121128/32419_1 /TAXON_ID=160604 /ORGANISM="Amphidinium massartii, Strain CS-259" /LENGTH=284 /DNA_ID=CAMNT_0020054493 /DNA_START=8 /DNA_END=862 /DNA_ORIENTATION=+